MFKSTDKKMATDINSNNIIGKGTTFTGNVETVGNIRIEGKVIGDVTSKSKVAIGPSAIIEGKVLSQVAEIEGTVKGKIEVTDLLILKPTSVVEGDILANKLSAESGAKFDGSCKMGQTNLKIEVNEAGERSRLKAS